MLRMRMSALGHKQSFSQCPLWSKSGHLPLATLAHLSLRAGPHLDLTAGAILARAGGHRGGLGLILRTSLPDREHALLLYRRDGTAGFGVTGDDLAIVTVLLAVAERGLPRGVSAVLVEGVAEGGAARAVGNGAIGAVRSAFGEALLLAELHAREAGTLFVTGLARTGAVFHTDGVAIDGPRRRKPRHACNGKSQRQNHNRPTKFHEMPLRDGPMTYRPRTYPAHAPRRNRGGDALLKRADANGAIAKFTQPTRKARSSPIHW